MRHGGWLFSFFLIGCNVLLGNEEPTRRAPPALETTTSGDAGTDAAPEATCSDDLETDPGNCGACGHDCLGGACVKGQCAPVLLASEQDHALRVVVEPGKNGRVYFTRYSFTSPGVLSVDKDGSNLFQIDARVKERGTYRPNALLVRAGKVYWTSTNNNDGPRGGVYWANADGTDRGSAGAWNGPWGIASDSTGLYVVGRWDARVLTHLGWNGQATTVHEMADVGLDYGAYDVVADDGAAGYVYWASSTGVHRVLKDGSGYVRLADIPAVNIVADGGDLFVLGQSAVHRIAKDGSSNVSLPQTLQRVNALTVDATHVWLTIDDTIQRMLKNGTNLETVWRDPAGDKLRDIAITDEALYFTAEFAGTVRKLAR